jgi:hypothetical protein
MLCGSSQDKRVCDRVGHGLPRDEERAVEIALDRDAVQACARLELVDRSVLAIVPGANETAHREIRRIEDGEHLLPELARAHDQPRFKRARSRVVPGVQDARVGSARAERQLGFGLDQDDVDLAAGERERDARAHDPAAYDTDSRLIHGPGSEYLQPGWPVRTRASSEK